MSRREDLPVRLFLKMLSTLPGSCIDIAVGLWRRLAKEPHRMEMNEVVRLDSQVRTRATLAAMLALLSVGCTHVTKPAAGTALSTDLSAICDKTTGYDVIIVGAGMSGLTAAKELRRGKADIQILVLEATDRIGGRARTLKRGPAIDLGGAWLHGVATNQLTGIVDTLGFKRVTTRLEERFFTEQGRVSENRSSEFWALNQTFEKLLGQAARNQLTLQACQELFSSSHESSTPEVHTSVQLSLTKAYCEHLSQRMKDNASGYLSIVHDSAAKALLAANTGPLDSAREIGDTSTVDAAEFEADDDTLVEEGLGTFVEAYGQGVPVCLNSPVTRITYGDDGVVVTTGGKHYKGLKTLVTVSAGVLKAGTLQFEPALPPRKMAALDELPMGHMQKVIIDFKDQEGLLPMTDENSWVLYVDSTKTELESSKAVMAFVIRPLKKNLAIAFYGGEQARDFEQQCSNPPDGRPLPPERQPCDEQAVRRAQEALGKMYSPAVAQAVEKADVYVTRWSLEPWTRGAYSAASPGAYVSKGKGSLPARDELARPLPYSEDPEGARHQVFFAGEACASPAYNGSLAGAYETGLREARRILKELYP